MKKLILLVLLFLSALAVHPAFAQSRIRVRATVVDAQGEPVIGASVIPSAGRDKNAAITGLDGTFDLTVRSNEWLEISCMGFKTKEIAATDANGQHIVLDIDANQLDELVVVGYGARKRESLTGSISSINSKEILTTVHTSLSESLAGKIAGFQIRQNTGEPGDYNTSINVRGFGAPLYVIDGVPSDLGAEEFQRINPVDIESISVIKDASAAIFGLRAANGVVLVKTRRGGGRARLNYNYVIGFESPTDMPEMCNRAQWAELRNDAAINAKLTPYFTREQLAEQQAGPSTDWYNEILKKFSLQQQHSLSASGGNDRISYFTSFGYITENGLLKTEAIDYDKYTFRANTTSKLASGLSLETNLSGMFDLKSEPSTGYQNVYYATVTCLPDSPPYIDGNPEYPTWQAFLNPIVLADPERTGYVSRKHKNLNAALSLIYDFDWIEGLQAKASASYSSFFTSEKRVAKAYKLYTYDADTDTYSFVTKNDPSTISNYNQDIDMLTIQAQLQYSKSFRDRHKVDATLVYEQHTYAERHSSLSREYSFFTRDQIDMATLNNMKNSGMEDQEASQSIVGRFNYDYRSKYLAEFAFREDGSYRYAPGKRWGFFPVFSAGWRISKEPFMRNVTWINELKLRGSIGLVGEDAGSPFQYVSAYSLSGGGGYEFEDGTWTDGASSPGITNPNLTWYTSNTKDIGITAYFFDNRLNFEFDVYQRDRRGLLSTRLTTIPNTFGASLPQENLNSDRVRGLDFTLGWRSHIGDFWYGINGTLNVARTMNKYIEEADPVSSYSKWLGGASYRYNDVMWGYEVIGQFQNQEEIDNAPNQGHSIGNTHVLPGDYRYRDVNNDGTIDGKDAIPLYFNGTPKLYYGLTFNAEWKGLDANVVLQGAGLYTVRYSGVYAEVLASELNTPAYFYDRWHQADPYDKDSEWIPGTWPAARLINNAGSNYYESNIWRRDASYIRLKSVEIGYTLKKKYRIYFAGHNLLTICDPFVKAFDPERSEGSNNMGFTYPLTRSFNIGVSLQF